MATIQNLNFNPMSIAGCSLWLDASDRLTILTTGNSVTQWNDKSGNGRNVTTTSGTVTLSTNALLFSSGGIMTGPSMTFDGSIFLACQPTAFAGGASFGMIIGRPGVDLSVRYTPSYVLNSPANASDLATNSAIVNGTQVSITNPALNTQMNVLYVPIVNAYTGSFSISNTFLSRFFVGTMLEIIMFTSPVTTAQRQNMEGYLAWKYNFQSSLPSTHPYKLVAPNSAGLAIPVNLPVSLPRQSFTLSASPLVSLFNPLSVSQCSLWLDGSDPATVTLSGSTVTQWRDKSSFSNNASRVSGTPTYSSNGIVLNRNNSDLFRTDLANSFVTGQTTIFYVAQVQTVAGIQDFMAFSDAGTVAVRYSNGLLLTAGDLNDFANNNYYVNGTFNPTIITTSTYTARHQVSGVNQYINANSRILLSDSFMSRYTSGTYNEVLVYQTALTTSQRQQVEGYLAWKWGIANALPASHPYKNAIPGPLNIPISMASFQSASFRPTQFSGASLWLDASDRNTVLSSGSSLTRWNDRITNGTQFAVPSPFAAPSIGTVNGLQSINVSSNSSTGLTLNCSNYTTKTTGFSYFITFIGSTGTSGRIFQASPVIGDRILTYAAVSSNVGFFAVSGTANANTAAPNVVNLLSIVENTVDGVLLVNGGTSVASTAVGTGTFSNMVLATGPAGADRLTGSLCEIIFYNRAVLPSERQTVEGYLAWKWGSVGSLPATHPFKRFPPPPS